MADEQTMSTSDALNELAKMKGIFRAVEHAEGVMLAVQRAEGRVTELTQQIKDLEDKAKSAQAYADGVSAAVADKQKLLNDFEKELDSKKAAAKKQFDADMVELAAHYSETSVAARDKVAQDLKDEQAKVDELTSKKSDLQRDVRILEAQIEVLTQKKATI